MSRVPGSVASWHRLSLRRALLSVLLPGMLLVIGAELWLGWRTAVDAANAAYDRSLLGAIKSIDANIATDSGGLGVELPYRMLEFFELTASGTVFYRVASEDGLVEIGNADLPAPPRKLISEQPQFSDAVYYGEPVRVGSYARELKQPLAGQPGAQRIVIQVAETLQSRQAFTRALLLQSLGRDVLLVLVAGSLLALTIGWALRPLGRLRDEVRSRSAQDMTPIAPGAIPADVQPLVDAINHHVARNRRQGEAQRRFVDDASHQLRTPLTTLTTQVGFALREADPAAQQRALHAIKAQLDETVRQTNQMLALGRSDSIDMRPERLDAAAFAEALAREWWPAAREHGIDLGFEAASDTPAWVNAQPALLKEALSNLLHNAIRYGAGRGGTNRGGAGQVTVRVQADDDNADSVCIGVLDNGPGMPEDERQRAGERFFRGSGASQPGTGLGLAIVRSIADRHGGHMRVHCGPHGRGLQVWLCLPRSDDAAQPRVSPQRSATPAKAF